MQFMT